MAPKVALEHAEHNGMKMKTSFPLLLTLKANKEEEWFLCIFVNKKITKKPCKDLFIPF